MNKKTISLQIIASIFLLIVILFSIFPSIPIGFCWEKKRFLSDQDFIDNAVEELINRPVQRITFPDDKSGQRYQPAYPVYYKNKEEFFAENPNCCSIYKRYGKYLSISIKYKVKYLDSKGYLHSYLVKDGTGGVLLNYCGKVY